MKIYDNKYQLFLFVVSVVNINRKYPLSMDIKTIFAPKLEVKRDLDIKLEVKSVPAVSTAQPRSRARPT